MQPDALTPAFGQTALFEAFDDIGNSVQVRGSNPCRGAKLKPLFSTQPFEVTRLARLTFKTRFFTKSL
jgi:hypothetical protein